MARALPQPGIAVRYQAADGLQGGGRSVWLAVRVGAGTKTSHLVRWPAMSSQWPRPR